MIPDNEKPLDTIQRHLKEIKEDLASWEIERNRLGTQQNLKYKSYCETWIRICKNTIIDLEKELANWLDD